MNLIWDTLAGAWGALWNWLLLGNLGVSKNGLWADLFKAASGLLAFCLLGLPISLKSADGIPRQLLERLRSHDTLRIYRLLPPLNVWCNGPLYLPRRKAVLVMIISLAQSVRIGL